MVFALWNNGRTYERTNRESLRPYTNLVMAAISAGN